MEEHAKQLADRLTRILRAVEVDETHKLHESTITEPWTMQLKRLDRIRRDYKGGRHEPEDTTS